MGPHLVALRLLIVLCEFLVWKVHSVVLDEFIQVHCLRKLFFKLRISTIILYKVGLVSSLCFSLSFSLSSGCCCNSFRLFIIVNFVMEIAIIIVNWSRFHRFDYLPWLLLSFCILIPLLVAWFKDFLTLLLRSPGLPLAFHQHIIHDLGISSSVFGGLPRPKANVNSLSTVIMATRDGAVIADSVVGTFLR